MKVTQTGWPRSDVMSVVPPSSRGRTSAGAGWPTRNAETGVGAGEGGRPEGPDAGGAETLAPGDGLAGGPAEGRTCGGPMGWGGARGGDAAPPLGAQARVPPATNGTPRQAGSTGPSAS